MNDGAAQIGALATKALDLLIEAVGQIPPESWDQPSNLDGWSVRELVGHATGSAAKVATLVEGGEVWRGPSESADWVCDDPAARLRELASRLRDAMPAADLDSPRASPEGEVALRRALLFPVCDLALHSWDVQRSGGRLVELPEDVVMLCRGLVESVGRFRPGAIRPSGLDADRAADGLSRSLGR